MGTIFCGDVVLDSFKKGSRDKDNILDQLKKQICLEYYQCDLYSLYHLTKMHTNIKVAQKSNFMSSLLLCAVFL